MRAVLGWIGEFFEVDRVTVWDYREKDAKFALSSSWQAPVAPKARPTSTVPPAPPETPDELFPWVVQRLLSGEEASFFDREELPPEAATDRQSFQRLGAQSHISLPLWIGAVVGGALSLDVISTRRDWSEVPTVRLQLLGNIIASALARGKTHDELLLNERRVRNVVSNTTEAVWCMEFGDPLPLDLPEEEAIAEFYRRGRMVETNDAMARIYGFENAEEMGEWTMEDYFDRDSESTRAALLAGVRARYRLVDVETVETPPGRGTGIYLNNLLPEIVDDKLVRLWGTSRDVTAVKRETAPGPVKERDETTR